MDTRDMVLEKAREKFKEENISFVNMDGGAMTFEDNSIDVVCISNTLHHLPNMVEILTEMKRVLKPGGFFLANEMFCDNQSERQLSHVYLHHLQGKIDTLLGICHNKTFLKEEILDIIKNLGLDIIETVEYNTHGEQEPMADIEEEREILDEIFQAISNKLKEIKDFPQYEEYMEEYRKLKAELYNIGFFTATELMTVARKA